MKGFSGDVTLKRLDVHNYELEDDFSYENNKIKVIAKQGMPTDGASIPKFTWRIIGSPLIGKYVGAALIHDALYTSQGLGKLNKEDVDKLFLEMMKVEGVSCWKRYAMYYAVKFGGRSAWESIEKDGTKYCEVKILGEIDE